MTLNRVWIPSPNYSSRSASPVRLIVLHTAEGALTYQSLGSFFASPSSGVSSHVGIDDSPNTIGEYVHRPYKAWTAANANPIAVQAELCAFAAWSSTEWDRHSTMLNNTSQWIAEEAAYFNIPLVRLTPQQAQTDGRGICQHSDLGSWGGNHSDCGPAFPIDEVIYMAGSPRPTPPAEEEDMPSPCVFTTNDQNQQVFYVDGAGNLCHYWWDHNTNRWSPREGLGGGWDTKIGITKDAKSDNQIWGQLVNGAVAQCYWSGSRWLTQALA